MNRTYLETSKEWAHFEEKMNLQDTFRLNYPLKRLYTFTSKANKTNKAKLDRMYCTSSLCGKIKSTIFTPTLLSHHKIVKVEIANKLDPENKIDFESHLNETMLYSALKSLKDNRSPGPDGL